MLEGGDEREQLALQTPDAQLVEVDAEALEGHAGEPHGLQAGAERGPLAVVAAVRLDGSPDGVVRVRDVVEVDGVDRAPVLDRCAAREEFW